MRLIAAYRNAGFEALAEGVMAVLASTAVDSTAEPNPVAEQKVVPA